MSHLLELNLDKIKRLAKLRETENMMFRSFLKAQDENEVDEVVHRINDEVSAQIDCTQCGNCCNLLSPGVTKHDAQKLAKCLHISVDQFRERYAEYDEDEREDYLKDTPCKFLKDKKCTVYQDRPEACQSYPNLHKDNFTSRLLSVVVNYGVCPIVFNVYEELKKEMNFR